MRPVNLLPPQYRPRSQRTGDSKTSYFALGALALLVLAVFGYVMASNQVTARNAEIAETRQKIANAEGQSVTLAGFGDFAGVKQARLTAVKSLATARLDWERLFRELAHVLPAKVWLTGFDGQAAASSDGGAGAEDAARALVLKGCAKDHRRIADVMVRLRELHAAGDVELTSTAKAVEEKSDGAAAATPQASTDSEQSGCGRHYSFDVAVTLEPPQPAGAGDGSGSVPASLGGGQ